MVCGFFVLISFFERNVFKVQLCYRKVPGFSSYLLPKIISLHGYTTFYLSLVPPILLFSSISFHCSHEKAFLSLLAILWSSAFSLVCLSLSPLPFASLLFSAICEASSDNHFAFLNFFFLRMVLISASCTMSCTLSIVFQAVCVSDKIPWIHFSLPLYNCKGFDLGYTWMV